MALEEPLEGDTAAGGGTTGGRGRTGTRRRDLVPRVRREVEAELARVRSTIRLLEDDRIGPVGYLALLLAIGVNIWGFASYGNRYMQMWVVASLYFYTTYWILPMIYGGALAVYRRKEFSRDGPASEPSGLLRSVKEARLLRFKRRLITVGWNVWFLGGVSMTAGYLAIFSVNILFAVLGGYFYRVLTQLTVILVVVQSAGIILYYLAVYLLRPYSTDFSAWLLLLLRGRQDRREKGLSSVAPTAVLATFSFVLAVLLVVAILLPGQTLDRILPVIELKQVRFNIFLLVLLATQLVFMQVLHRWLSRSIARPVLASSEQSLAREARALRFMQRTSAPRQLRRIDRAVSLLAETRLYRVEPIRLTGIYTLFLLGSDFLAVLALRDVRRMDPRLRLPGRTK